MRTERLDNLLRRSSNLLMLAELARTAAAAVAALVVAALVVLGVDAALGLGSWGLVTLDLVLGGLIAAAVAALVAVLVRGRYLPKRTAVRVEQRLGIPDSRLINAVDLAGQTPGGVSPSLREHAVSIGNELAARLPAAAVVDRDRLVRAGIGVAAALGLVVLAYGFVPGVFHAVLPRLVAPSADHPPYTHLKFDVRIEPQPIFYGKRAAIGVAITGPTLPETATVVFVSDGAQTQRVAMLRTAAAPVARAAHSRSTAVTEAAHFVLRIDRAERSRTFYIDTPGGRSRRFTLEVRPVPLFERVVLDYRFPDYTGWAPSSEELKLAGIRTLVGTVVSVSATSNVPLERGDLTLTPSAEAGSAVAIPARLESDPADPHTVRGTFTLAYSVEFAMTLAGVDGTQSVDTLRGGVVALPDGLPRVDISEPPPRLIVPEGWVVDVVVEATDDIGISRMVLHRGVNGWGPTPFDLEPDLDRADNAFATVRYAFDLGALGARAGDVITYFATAYDNHPSGGQFTQTDVHAIQVISLDDYLDHARAKFRIEDLPAEWEAYQARLDELEARRQRILEQLDELQQELDSDEPLSGSDRQRIEQLEAELDAYTAESLALFEDLRRRAEQSTLYEFENPYKELLRRLGAELQPQATGAADLSRALAASRETESSVARSRLAAAAQQFRELDRPFTDPDRQQRRVMEQDLERLELADQMIWEAERIRQVVAAQQDLAFRMAEFHHHQRPGLADQLKMRRLAEEQAVLRQELDDARDQLRETAQVGGDKLPNMWRSATAICDAIDRLEILGDQDEAELQANAGQGPDAYRAARSAADKLDSLLTDAMTPGGAGGSGDLDGCLSLPRFNLTNALQQMANNRSIPGLGPGGSTGAGFTGSEARVAIMGPAVPGQGESEADGLWGGRDGGDGRGGRGEAGAGEPETAEAISAGRSTKRGGASGVLSGVPQVYRDEAEAYFERLAEENR